jgi:methyltransferase (TIGR00027 family)
MGTLTLRPSIVARTRFFDDQVLAALAAGVTQVVICGAGYDDRALRFRTAGVRFFEVDHPATQVDKARRLKAIGAQIDDLVLVPADFRAADVAEALAQAGHDADRRSLFTCEGLLVYLDVPTTARLLGGLRTAAAPGSVLAASLAAHAEGRDSVRVVAAANARRRNAEGEPWRTILAMGEHRRILESAGWRVTGNVDAADLNSDAPPGRTQLVTARPS